MIMTEPNRDEVYKAALKVVEALDVDASTIKVPVQIALALVNLQRAVNGASPMPQPEERFADALARKCDELEAESKALREENSELKVAIDRAIKIVENMGH